MSDHFQQWSTLAPRGLLTIGLGVCLTADAATRRAKGGSLLLWILEGSLGLAAINAGVSIFGESVKQRLLYEQTSGQKEV